MSVMRRDLYAVITCWDDHERLTAHDIARATRLPSPQVAHAIDYLISTGWLLAIDSFDAVMRPRSYILSPHAKPRAGRLLLRRNGQEITDGPGGQPR